MRILFITVISLSFSFLAEAQQKIIKLKPELLDLKPGTFYIKDVIDVRNFKANIGFVQVGMFNKKIAATLEGGVEQSLLDYINSSLPKDTNLTPVILKVVRLRISEQISYSSEVGRADVQIEFYTAQNGDLQKVHKASSVIEDTGIDVTKTHGHRIQTAINTCIKDFINTEKNKNVDVFYYEGHDEVQLKNKPDVVYSSSVLNDRKPEFANLLTVVRTYGVNATSWGASYAAYTADSLANWIFPWGISMERFTVRQEYFNQFNYHMAKWNYFMPGISAYRKITKQIYVNFSFRIPMGTEVLTDFSDNTTTKYVIGIAPSQGFQFIANSKFGLTIGLGIYERLLTSEVYNSDIGIKVNVGFKF